MSELMDKLDNLRIYREAEELVDEIWYEVCSWNNFDKMSLGLQMIKSVDSISVNIAEGYGRYHFKETLNFLYIARGSLIETESWITKSFRRNKISKDKYNRWKSKIDVLLPQLNAYISSRRRKLTKQKNTVLPLILSLFIFSSFHLFVFSSEGTSTANFLKIGIGARAIALGEAFTAVSDDVTAVYWNPSGLAQLQLYEVSLMHNKWVEDINYQFAGYAIPLKGTKSEKPKAKAPAKSVDFGTLGISAYYLSMEPIQGYYGAETPGREGTESQKLTANDFATALSYGRQVYGSRLTTYGSRLFAGTTLKFINKKLADKTASGFAADISALYLPSWSVISGGRLRFGLNIRNIGTGLTFDKESSPFPLDVKFGIGWTRDIFGNNFVFALDYSYATNSVAVGAEYPVWDMIVLRAGYKVSKHIDSGLRAGIGIGTRHIRLDYAFAPFGFLGETHRFSLNFKFGRKPTTVDKIQEMVRKHYLRAQRLYQKDELIASYREFKAVISFDSTHEESLKKVQEIELAFKEFKTEIERVKREREIEKQIEIGKEYFNNGEFEKAKSQFKTILELQPENKVAQEYLTKIEKEYDKWTKAEIKRLFTEVEILHSKGTYKDYQEALKRLERIIELDPKNLDAQKKLAETQQKISEIEEARKKEEEVKLKAKEEKRVQELYKQAINLYNNGNWQDAIKGFKEVIKFYPGHKEAMEYLQKAEVGLEKKKQQDAIKSQELYTEGVKEYTAGNIKKAIELWENAVKLDPENVKAQKSLERAKEELKKK